MNLKIIGNSASPHLRSWTRVLSNKFNLDVYDINRKESSIISGANIQVHKPLYILRTSKMKIIQYIILGFWLRFNKIEGIIHAHNTSGYGIAALISGKRYIVTTYGSEIYEAYARGRIFSWLISQVLRRASLVTASTPYMKMVLQKSFRVDPKKIFCKMQIDQIFIDINLTSKSTKQKTWFVNRRMTDLYCTIEVVEAFKLFLSQGGMGNLILLEGDSDKEYTQRVENAIEGNKSIRIVKGIVDQNTIIKILNCSHFTVSVPKTDQLSSSILESSACQSVPILRNLDSYSPVSSICIFVDDNIDLVEGLREAFVRTSSLSDSQLRVMSSEARDFVLTEFSPKAFLSDFSERVNELS